MKVVLAPDSFKESMTALEVCEAFDRGFRKVFPEAEIVKVPMADGGEGTVQSLVDATGGKIFACTVTGPLGKPVEAFFGMLGGGKSAVIEMAAASGLHLVDREERNPLITTTKGTGELILAALDQGAEHIIIGLGGSATNDGGAGMAKALGVKLLDQNGEDIEEGGGALGSLAVIDLADIDSRLAAVKIEIACDVDNPLIGPRGASAIFGPQKGATPEMVLLLDHNLGHFASVIEAAVGSDIQNIPGAGAAGGLGAGLMAFLNAELKRGVDIVLEASQLAQKLEGADFVITGEGKIDSQTIYGKTPIGVAKTAKKFDIPVIAIAGNIAKDSSVVKEHGIDALFSIVPGAVSLDDALSNALDYTERTAENIASILKLSLS
ncbi:glycerate kinase [Peribacillus saganii]|uniref:Glycerate kinase n=1 Tax=Peribacillus saganii TaxID=2303992 RepID=A0A372LKU7_9BACI|nr:glycerate kinase [Peribacillus saganii]RFU66318.1 glycerate kinase [Peribacillus saganii]